MRYEKRITKAITVLEVKAKKAVTMKVATVPNSVVIAVIILTKVRVKGMIKELEQQIFANELMYKVEKGYIQPNLVIVARL